MVYLLKEYPLIADKMIILLSVIAIEAKFECIFPPLKRT